MQLLFMLFCLPLRLSLIYFKHKVLKGYTKEALENNVSEIDSHPNAKGQEMIAEFLYEQL